MTKIRHKLGVKFTKELEQRTYVMLIEKKIIRGKGLLVDATVMPEKIKYPNEVRLMNDVREWVVGWLKEISGKTGEWIRTYRRMAKKLYLNFAKKKLKSWKLIEKTKKQVLQYVRRNPEQLRGRLGELDYLIRKDVEERLKVAERIYKQQKQMYDEKVQRVSERVVSWWREYVRPIERGKSGGKEVEFGPKVCLSHVDGFRFLDEFNHENYSEARADIVEKQIKNYEARFGKMPEVLVADQAYGSRENRAALGDRGIRVAFKALGRKSRDSAAQEEYVRRKQRERNRIEGDIGNVKEHYGCDGIRYHYREGSEMWVRLGLLAKNLKVAAVRVA